MRWVLLAVLFFPFFLVSAQGLNAGFVQGLWYSKTPFFAEETIRIYTAIQNNSGFDIQGTVVFLVNGNSVGESEFSAVNGRIVEVWTDWNVQQGNHSIGAQISKAVKIEIGKDPEPISLGAVVLGVSQVFADQDTDQDEIGNLQDPDDDNDGLSDTQEQNLGTDPLQQDTDQDGLGDATEIEEGTDPLLSDTDGDGTPDGVDTEPLIAGPTIPTEPVSQEQNSFPQKVVGEYIPKIDSTLDAFFENIAEDLKEKKEGLGQKIAQEQRPKPLLAGPLQKVEETTGIDIPEEKMPALDELRNLFLAAAVVALPQWRLAFLLLSLLVFGVIVKKYMWT